MTPIFSPPHCEDSSSVNVELNSTLIAGLHGEIAIHETIFLWFLVPVFGVILVAFSLSYSLLVAISSFLGADTDWIMAASCGFTVLVACFAPLHLRQASSVVPRSGWRRFLYGPVAEKRCIEFEEGEGSVLEERVGMLWPLFADAETHAPKMSWFLERNYIAARALADAPDAAIEVSYALWTNVRSRKALVDFILLHEMAHVCSGDVRRVVRIDKGFVIARSSIICILAIAVPVAVVFWLAWAYDDVTSLARGDATPDGIVGPLPALLTCMLMIAPAPISLLVLKRYAGFISSLIETRADLTAAHLGGGVQSFVETFRNDAKVAQSTWREISKSFWDPAITHPPAGDRLEIMNYPNRLAAPKFRYFAMSMLLPSLMYLNPVLVVMPQLFWVGCVGQLICGSALLLNISLSLTLAGTRTFNYTFRTCVVFAAGIQAIYATPLFGGTRLVEFVLSLVKWLTVPGAGEALPQALEDLQAILTNVKEWLSSPTFWIDATSGSLIAFAAASIIPKLQRHAPHDLQCLLRRAILLGCLLVAAQWAAFYLRFEFPAFTFNVYDYILGPRPPPPGPWAFLVPLTLLVGGSILSIAPSRTRRDGCT